MYKETLFELIRKEEVILWVGAGFSVYAGFPNGNKLKDIIYNSLNNQEKKLTKKSKSLSDLAEEYFRIKAGNKNQLIKLLSKTFLDFTPTSTLYHDILVTIPHFSTIITTNFDKLLENAYGKKAQILFNFKQIPYIEKNKVQIFKIHGDLSEPESIIITTSDYGNLFKNNFEDDAYWDVIKERLSTRSVLFLGYDLEDINVSVIFEKIYEKLGIHRKQCFLIAPNLQKHKILDLNRKGIQYIKSTAQKFINDLSNNLKENIIDDLQKGKTSAETFREFLYNLNLLPDLRGNKHAYQLHSIRTIQPHASKLRFTIKNDKKDTNFISNLTDILSGKNFGSFTIPKEKINSFSLSELKFPDLKEIVIKSRPKIKDKFDIRFEDNYEYNNIPIEIYSSSSKMEILVGLKVADLTFALDTTNLPEIRVKMHYKHRETCTNVKEEIELFTFLFKLSSGYKFTVYSGPNNILTEAFPIQELLKNECRLFLNYFRKLKEIEYAYNIRFVNFNFNSINEETHKLIKLINSVINGEIITQDCDDEISMDILDDSEEILQLLKNIEQIPEDLVGIYNEEEKIELHGQIINLGYKTVVFNDAVVTNIDSILSKKEKQARFRSKINRITISYSKKMNID